MRRLLIAIALLCSFVGLFAAVLWAALVWEIDTVDRRVDRRADVVGLTSLALGANGYPHISYYDAEANDDLKYAAWNGKRWDIQIVDSDEDAGASNSLALDANGYPHISYYARSSTNAQRLKYAAWNGASWDIETVDWGSQPSLALDANGYPHISYNGKTTTSSTVLRYAAWNGASWDFQIVDSGERTGAHSSLALDANGYPHISAFDVANQALKYSAWNGASWDIETVDAEGGRGSSLALDANGYPHISHTANIIETHKGYVKYAAWNGASWDFQIVASNDSGYYRTSLALDANGYPHISYIDRANDDVKYAAWNGASWDIEIVDDCDDRLGPRGSLALDAWDYPHISYIAKGNLKYAAAAPPPTNRPPVAADDSYSTDQDATLTVALPGVLGNDSDPDGDPIIAIWDSGPSHGTFGYLNADGSFEYTPGTGFTGTDAFTYTAFDGEYDSNVATVTITVGGALEPGGITGIVTDAAGNPVKKAIVTAYDALGDPAATGKTLPSGAYSLSGLEPGEYTVEAVLGELSGWAEGSVLVLSGQTTMGVDIVIE